MFVNANGFGVLVQTPLCGILFCFVLCHNVNIK